MQKTRVVFDVNIFVSYIIKDRMDEIFDMVFEHNICLYCNAEMRAELELACQTNAHYLVSGDKKVLATPIKKSFHLVTLSVFKKVIY